MTEHAAKDKKAERKKRMSEGGLKRTCVLCRVWMDGRSLPVALQTPVEGDEPAVGAQRGQRKLHHDDAGAVQVEAVGLVLQPGGRSAPVHTLMPQCFVCDKGAKSPKSEIEGLCRVG